MNRHILFHLQVILLVLTSLGSSKAQTIIPELDWQQITSDVYAGIYPALAWSPDSHYIAIGNANTSNLLIFDMQEEFLETQIDLAVQEQYLQIPSIEWSHDGKYIAVLVNSTVIIVDVANTSVLQTHANSGSGNLVRLDWIHGSQKIALLDNLGFIYIYDVLESRVVMSMEIGPDMGAGETYVYNTFDWNEKRNWFAVPLLGSSSIVFWDGEGNVVSELVRPDPDRNNWLASNCNTSAAVDSTGANIDLHNLRWSHDGSQLAITIESRLILCSFSSDGTSVQWRELQGVPNPDHDPNQVYSSAYFGPDTIAWSYDDSWLFGYLGGLLSPACGIGIYDANQDYSFVGVTGESICGNGDLDWSPDGKLLAIRNENSLWIGSFAGH